MEGLGDFAYASNFSIDYNITTILLASTSFGREIEECRTVKEALKVRKEFTLCRICKHSNEVIDLRKIEDQPFKLRGHLSTDSEMPWTICKLDDPLVAPPDFVV